MAKLDLKRLSADTKRHPKKKVSDPGARRLTGAMEIVRDNLQEIEALNADGQSWVAIAAALAQQGVTQGDNQPISAKRLTALIASVKRQAARKTAKEQARAQRRDLSSPASAEPTRSTLRLAAELTRPLPKATPPAIMTEDDIRRVNFDKHSKLFKKE